MVNIKMRRELTVLLMICSTCCWASAIAQDDKSVGIAKRKFKHDAKIEASYDPASNETKVVLNPYRIYQSTTESFTNADYISMMGGFTFRGRVLTTNPNRAELHLISDSGRSWKFDEDSERVLTIIVDGERIELGAMTLLSARHYHSEPYNGRSGYLEHVYTALTYEGILKVAGGKHVVLNVGKQTLELRSEPMEALRDLVSRMTP